MSEKIKAELAETVEDRAKCIWDFMESDRDGYGEQFIYGEIIKQCAYDLKYLRNWVNMSNITEFSEFFDTLTRNWEFRDILLTDLEKLQDTDTLTKLREHRKKYEAYEVNFDDTKLDAFSDEEDKSYKENLTAYNLLGILDRNGISPVFASQAANFIILWLGGDPTVNTESE